MYNFKYLKHFTGDFFREARYLTLIDKYTTSIEKHSTVKKISYDMMKTFAEKLFCNVFLQALVVGNTSNEIAYKCTKKILELLNPKSLKLNQFPLIKGVELPQGERCLRIKSFNKQDVNSIVTNYYQIGSFTTRKNLLIELILVRVDV